MIRDARSVAHSIITRKVTITGYDLSSYPDVIGKWDAANSLMWEQCKSLGPQYCMPVHYEHLVLEKETVLRAIGYSCKINIPSGNCKRNDKNSA